MLNCMIVLLLLAAEPQVNRRAPVAVIVEVTGVATRTDGEDTRPVRRVDLLRPGDRVAAGMKGTVTVLFVADGHRERLTAGAAIVVGEDKGQPTGRVEQLPATLSGANLDSLRAMIRSGKIGGGTFRGDEPPKPAVAPVDGTLVASDRPSLRWPPMEGATGYRLVILSGPAGANEKEIRNEATKAAEWRYPAADPALTRNRVYRWRVLAKTRDGQERLILTESRFTVGPAEMEKQAVALTELARSKDPGDLLVAVLGFESLGLLDELYSLYATLTQQIRDDANLWAKTAEYASRAGRPQEAATALMKARELGWKPNTP